MISRRLIVNSCVAVLMAGVALAAGPAKRARPPKFSEAVTDAFFPNALEKLSGPRPPRGPAPAPQPAPAESSAPTAPAADDSAATWPGLIDATALEDEIKAQHRALGRAVDSPLKFKGGQFQDARLRLSLLAAMFAIASEYGEPVRWQREATSMRNRLAKGAANCKVGTDASFQDAKTRYEELETLMRGESLDAPPATETPNWPEIANRAMLMKRLEQALDAELTPKLASPQAFSASSAELLHESQIVAALAEVIAREGYEYADDDAFRQSAADMQSRAAGVRQAIAQNNYEAVRQGVGEISKSCASCHESFRN